MLQKPRAIASAATVPSCQSTTATHHSNASSPYAPASSKPISRNQSIKLHIDAHKLQFQLPPDPPTNYLNLLRLARITQN